LAIASVQNSGNISAKMGTIELINRYKMAFAIRHMFISRTKLLEVETTRRKELNNLK